jgi:hypothetical protein
MKKTVLIKQLKNRKFKLREIIPLYEWQWLVDGKVSELSYYTEEEHSDIYSSMDITSTEKISSSKRLRTK